MGEVKQYKIENRTYYFYNDMINIKDFYAGLLKIDKKSYKDISIYNIGYITKKKIDDCNNIYSVIPLYLFIDHANGYIEEKDLNSLYLNIDHVSGYNKEKDVNKYFGIFDSADENKELLKKYNHVWNGIKNKIKEVDDSENKIEIKDYMNISFNSDDNLPLSNPLKLHNMTITIRSVFEEDGNFIRNYF